MGGSSPATPKVVTPIPTPAPESAASTTIISNAASGAALAAKQQQGPMSTILTGPMGLAQTSNSPGKQLLG